MTEYSKEFREFYLKQIKRIEGAKCRAFPPGTYDVWWVDGVKKYDYTRSDIEHAATKLAESSDPFPMLSNFIHHCGAARRRRRDQERLEEERLGNSTRTLDTGGILQRGLKNPKISPASKKHIDNALDLLKGKINKATFDQRAAELKKGE